MTGLDLSAWEWTCACCGARKRGIPDLAFDGPVAWRRADRDPDIRVLEKSDDFCEIVIHGDRFTFIRCVLPVPLAFAPGEFFGFGVWSTLGRENALRYRETFHDDDQGSLGAMFGYLGNVLPGYPDTENLRLTVQPRDGGQRPLVRVQDHHSDHPLWRDQRDGIGEDRLADLLSRIMPCDGRA